MGPKKLLPSKCPHCDQELRFKRESITPDPSHITFEQPHAIMKKR
jgi:hypothetical protein